MTLWIQTFWVECQCKLKRGKVAQILKEWWFAGKEPGPIRNVKINLYFNINRTYGFHGELNNAQKF